MYLPSPLRRRCRHRPPSSRALAVALISLLGLAFLSIGPVAAAASPATRTRPNILFLLTDDQRADTLHALGNPRIHTPNLDRLVREGFSFTRAHIMGGLQGAVCVPSRAMLLGGRSLFRVREDLRDTETWPSQLGRAGWQTFITGKWHNGTNALFASFQTGSAIFLGGMTDQNKVPLRDLASPWGLGPERIAHRPSSELFADAAVAFLDRAPTDRPFCLYVAFTSPHDPRTPPAEYLRRYPPDRIRLPPNVLPEHPFDNGELKVRDELLLPIPRDPAALRRETAAYYAMISHVDHQIGRILAALQRSGRYQDTIIVYAGDNGLALGSHGLLGKQNLYEHSTRVPLVVAGPGVLRHRRSEAFVYLHDLALTLCELAGVPAPAGAEGYSLAPFLAGGPPPPRDTVFTAYRHLQRAVTDGTWKLIEYPRIGRTQLFDLRHDPAELHDLAGLPETRGTQARMTTLLREQQRRYADPHAPPTTP